MSNNVYGNKLFDPVNLKLELNILKNDSTKQIIQHVRVLPNLKRLKYTVSNIEGL